MSIKSDLQEIDVILKNNEAGYRVIREILDRIRHNLGDEHDK